MGFHLIIIAEFLPPADPPVSKDDDVPVRQLHRLRHAVGLAAVVDVPGHPSGQGGVHYPVVVQTEHVDASVL